MPENYDPEIHGRDGVLRSDDETARLISEGLNRAAIRLAQLVKEGKYGFLDLRFDLTGGSVTSSKLTYQEVDISK